MLEVADLAPDHNKKGMHKELTKGRMKKDNGDITTLIKVLLELDPFNKELTNLVIL